MLTALSYIVHCRPRVQPLEEEDKYGLLKNRVLEEEWNTATRTKELTFRQSEEIWLKYQDIFTNRTKVDIQDEIRRH